MRSRGKGKRRGIGTCLGVFLAFLMVTTPGADYRTLYGDGLWHDMGGGWWYAYNKSLNDCYWRYSGVSRFAYDYDRGQWWDNRTSWGTLGASGISTDDFIGDGVYHSLNNGWTFAYNKALSDSYWKTGSAVRFAYDYDGGRWWHNRTSWYTLGAAGLSQSFVGDGSFHGLNDGWSYAYNKAIDNAYWKTGSDLRFCYAYDRGQWWDYYGSRWHMLGLSSYTQSFIGDGTSHSFTGGGSYTYSGVYGFWHYGSSDVYRIAYGTSTLYLWEGRSWQDMTSYTSKMGPPTSTSNPEIRYVGDWGAGRFVETRLCNWGGNDYRLIYDYVAWSTAGERTWITDWAIFKPGADRIWSGTNGLKIGFIIADGRPQWGDSKEDVIHFYDIDGSYKYYSFESIVMLIRRMTQFYGTLADIVAITQHGLPDRLGIGTDTVTSSNCSSYASLFTEWGTYMKTNSQIHFNHCLVAARDMPFGFPAPRGVDMLNAIAAYSRSNIFASDDPTQIGPPQWPGNPNGYDWYMEYASNGNSLSYNCIYNYDTTINKPYDPEWWKK